MDRERVIAKVRQFLQRLDEHLDNRNISSGPGLEDDLMMQLPAIWRIAETVDSGLRDGLALKGQDGRWQWRLIRTVTVLLLGELEGQQEIDEMLAPKGPTLAAKGLHPWVWEPAARMWDQGSRRAAIQAAATHLDIQLQAKLNRHNLSGDALVKQAFSMDKPILGEPRLRLPGYKPGSKDFTSAHAGAMQFGAGCMMAIRNLATHDLAEPDEQVALEQLKALSVLARWIDAADVQRTDQP